MTIALNARTSCKLMMGTVYFSASSCRETITFHKMSHSIIARTSRTALLAVMIIADAAAADLKIIRKHFRLRNIVKLYNNNAVLLIIIVVNANL